MATVYIFNGTQSGSADGSYSDPYDLANITTAETNATSGGTIIFKNGTYTISNHLNLASVITYGVTYKPENAGQVTISGSFGVRVGNTSMTGSIIMDDIIMDIGDINQLKDYQLRIINASGGSITLNRCNCTIDRKHGSFGSCAIGDNSAHASSGEAYDLFLNECVFKINMSATAATYESGIIGGGSDSGGPSKPKNSTIKHCTFISNTTGVSTFAQFNNNGTKSYGSVSVTNSILYHAGTSSSLLIYGSSTAASATFTNCNLFDGWTQSFATVTDAITTDPQFVDYANNDYRLRPTSPCINAGTAS
jgi:hypothetical protein